MDLFLVTKLPGLRVANVLAKSRTGIARRPGGYRWTSLGYHMQARNAEGFLSMDFGLREFVVMDAEERLYHYRPHKIY